MKKITLLIALMITSLGFAQNLITNGDFANGGTDWVFTSPGVVSNGEAFFSTANAGGNPWDTELKQVGKSFTAGSTYTLTFKARAAANRNISVNIQNTGIWNDQFRNNAVALTTTMTTYTYVFVATSTNANAQLNFHMANLGANTTAAVYIDDVTLTLSTATTCNNGVQDGDETGIDCGGSCAPCEAVPTVAAQTPPNRNPSDVKSIFSDAYTPITTFNYAGVDGQASNDNTYDTSWSSANTALVQVVGNNTNKITSMGFQGIAFLGGRFDASTFTHLHIDIWTPTATLDKSFNLKLVNFNGGSGEANAIEFSVTNASNPALTNPNPGTWYTLDIPLASFTIAGGGSSARNDLAQFVITSDLGTVYYDNLYFYKGTALSTEKFSTSNVKMYPNPVKNTLTIEANSEIQRVSVFNILGQEVMKASPKSNTATLQTNELQKGVYMVTTEIDGKLSTSKVVKE